MEWPEDAERHIEKLPVKQDQLAFDDPKRADFYKHLNSAIAYCNEAGIKVPVLHYNGISIPIQWIEDSAAAALPDKDTRSYPRQVIRIYFARIIARLLAYKANSPCL